MPATRDPLLREQPWNQPTSLGQRYDITPAESDFVPHDLDEAVEFILATNPPEVAAYDGSREVQRSVAREIAMTLFVSEEHADRVDVVLDSEPQTTAAKPSLRLADIMNMTIDQRLAVTTFRATVTPADQLTTAVK